MCFVIEIEQSNNGGKPDFCHKLGMSHRSTFIIQEYPELCLLKIFETVKLYHEISWDKLVLWILVFSNIQILMHPTWRKRVGKRSCHAKWVVHALCSNQVPCQSQLYLGCEKRNCHHHKTTNMRMIKFYSQQPC